MRSHANLSQAIYDSESLLLEEGLPVETETWQGVPTEGKPDLRTREVLGLYWAAPMPKYLVDLREQVQPNLPWADEHFAERVSRVPSNPGEAYKSWPWWKGQTGKTHDFHGQFTHTYQERMWSRMDRSGPGEPIQRWGIRYRYGDLDDLVDLLARHPHTRQAYLPIFFPEDTGAVHEGRTPCTLGYQFLLRRGRLDCFYVIRSCDMVRHFRDDVYLAVRLAMWVLDEVKDKNASWSQMKLGMLHFLCFSFHLHEGDRHLVVP